MPDHMPDVVDGLFLWALHANVLVLDTRLERTLLARGGNESDWRGIDIVVEAFRHLELDTIVCPRMDIIVSIEGWIRCKTCPFAVGVVILSKTLILETIEFSEFLTDF